MKKEKNVSIKFLRDYCVYKKDEIICVEESRAEGFFNKGVVKIFKSSSNKMMEAESKNGFNNKKNQYKIK